MQSNRERCRRAEYQHSLSLALHVVWWSFTFAVSRIIISSVVFHSVSIMKHKRECNQQSLCTPASSIYTIKTILFALSFSAHNLNLWAFHETIISLWVVSHETFPLQRLWPSLLLPSYIRWMYARCLATNNQPPLHTCRAHHSLLAGAPSLLSFHAAAAAASTQHCNPKHVTCRCHHLTSGLVRIYI